MATSIATSSRAKTTPSKIIHHEVEVTKLTPLIGAEVSGIDLSEPMTPVRIQEIRSLLLKHKVLVFRDQELSPSEHVAFARNFGDLEVHPVFEHHPEHPELVMLRANADKPGQENVFHSDTTFRDRPAMGSVLRCVSCPEVGGDTIWCNMVVAYEKLPAAVKKAIEGLTAIHDLLPSFANRLTPEKRVANRAAFPAMEHPVVRTHPETGEKILFVNQAFTTHLSSYNDVYGGEIGRERKLDVDNLLLYLTRQAEIPEHQVRIRWAPNTVVFWDNRSTQHYAVQDYFPASRHMQRATIIGDRPI